MVAPSRKVTVPVRVPTPGATALTFAVSITNCPRIAGLGDADKVVEVPAWLTTCVNAPDVLGATLLSPPYAAVMLWLPTTKEDVLRIAVPGLIVAVPSVVAPSLNVTTPVGVRGEDPTGLTVAVKLTC